MKKIYWIFILLILLTGCSLDMSMKNTPTKEVEKYLDSYQKLDDNILNDLDLLVENSDYNIEQKAEYKEVLKKHYTNMTYEITGEKIVDDKAYVTAKVEVTNFSLIKLDKADYTDKNGVVDINKYHDDEIEKLKNVNEKVKYDITFNLTKKDKEWVIDDLSKEDTDKINGVYVN